MGKIKDLMIDKMNDEREQIPAIQVGDKIIYGQGSMPGDDVDDMVKEYYKYAGNGLYYIPSKPDMYDWSADTVRQWSADPNSHMWYDMEYNTLYANGGQVNAITSLRYYHKHPIANISFECSAVDIQTRYVGHPHLTEIHHIISINGIWLQVEYLEQHDNKLIVCCQALHMSADESKDPQREGYAKR